MTDCMEFICNPKAPQGWMGVNEAGAEGGPMGTTSGATGISWIQEGVDGGPMRSTSSATGLA